ncbi:MAG: hypothetical protein CRU78_03625 [Candidatus Accumulibacter phosphatis]|uniref:Uncharacterized protein n=1 Tax=Candidatus Accumulibacter phosphatis TaxID=327160 RepID=A0A6A7RRW9_9PROT|nr:hypothetical protein [Candidatus Accumulibacter phosphatis]
MALLTPAFSSLFAWQELLPWLLVLKRAGYSSTILSRVGSKGGTALVNGQAQLTAENQRTTRHSLMIIATL